MTVILGVFLFLVLVLALLVIGLLTLASRSASSLNKKNYQAAWLKINNNFKKDQVATYQVAVLEADKLLDKALKDRKMPGETMGERLKSAKNIWKNTDAVWAAHKLRNRLAHESDVQLSYRQAAQALIAFKQALRDLGAI